ncbi:hypothetical protein IT575_11520 [bacterium]|nr:hypothetical protein [bacterium]
MPAAPASRPPALNWELLRRVAARELARPGAAFFTWLGLGLALGLTLWTLLRPFNPRRMEHNLEQLAVWLSAELVLLCVAWALTQWLAGGRDTAAQDRDNRSAAGGLPLPLPPLQLFLHRSMGLALLPLRSLLLILPLWLAVCLYIQLPYGQSWVSEDISYAWYGPPREALWLGRLVWLGLNLVSAALLPLAWALLLQESLRSRALRAVLLLLPGVGIYCAQHFFDYHLRAPYQQTRGYEPLSFLAPLALLLCGAFCIGLLRPSLRLAALALAALLFSGLALWPALRDDYLLLGGRRMDAPLAARYLLLHLSPPGNARLLLRSMTSNVVLQDVRLLRAPAEPQDSAYPLRDELDALLANGAEPEDPRVLELQQRISAAQEQLSADYDAYWQQMESYEAQYEKLPRLPLLFGAGVLPLLLPLLLGGGLALGAVRRIPAEG